MCLVLTGKELSLGLLSQKPSVELGRRPGPRGVCSLGGGEGWGEAEVWAQQREMI